MESLADAVGVLENAPDFDLFPEGWNDVSTVSEAAATSPTPVTPPAKKRRLSPYYIFQPQEIIAQ